MGSAGNRAVVFWLVVASLVGMASLSGADEDDGSSLEMSSVEVLGDEQWLISTSVTSVTLASAYGMYAVGLGERDLAAVERYLRRNGRAVQRDLHLGAGDAIRDLARIFGVGEEDVEDFGRLLYRRRASLVQLVEPVDVDREATERFVDEIAGQMARDPAFSPDPAIERLVDESG